MRQTRLHALLFAVAAAAACAPTVVIKHWPDHGKPQRIAVLPFTDASGAPGSGLRAATAFSGDILALSAYEVVERAAIDDVLKEHQLGTSGLVDEANAVQVGKLLNADAVVLGSVTEYRDRRAVFFPSAVALSVRAVATKTCVVSWTASHRVGGNKRLFTWIVWPVGVAATVLSPSADEQLEAAARAIVTRMPKEALKVAAR